MNEQDKFLADIKKDDDKLDETKDLDGLMGGKPKEEVKEEEKEEEESPRNRRERRMQEKLQKEREANIALNARLSAMAELSKQSKDSGTDIDPDLLQAFGTNEEGKVFASLMSKKLSEVEVKAYEKALEKIEADRKAQLEQEAKDSEYIDNQLESIEDRYNVDLSGNTKSSRELRNGFIDFLEQISPKDERGEIREYADFDSAFETYQKLSSKEKPKDVSNRQKELGSRGLEQSGQAGEIKQQGPRNFSEFSNWLDKQRMN